MFKNMEEIWRAVERGLISMKSAQEYAEQLMKAPGSVAGMSDSVADIYAKRMEGRGMAYCSTTYMPSCSTDADYLFPEDEEKFVKCDHCNYENAWERGSCDMCGAPLVHMPDDNDKITYEHIVDAVAELEAAPTYPDGSVEWMTSEPVMKPSLWSDLKKLAKRWVLGKEIEE